MDVILVLPQPRVPINSILILSLYAHQPFIFMTLILPPAKGIQSLPFKTSRKTTGCSDRISLNETTAICKLVEHLQHSTTPDVMKALAKP